MEVSSTIDQALISALIASWDLVSEKRMQSLIAKALRTDLDKSVELSMKAVRFLVKS